MVNGLIKINEDYDVDFSFIDKVLINMVGIQKKDLLHTLKVNDANCNADAGKKKSTNKKDNNTFQNERSS